MSGAKTLAAKNIILLSTAGTVSIYVSDITQIVGNLRSEGKPTGSGIMTEFEVKPFSEGCYVTAQPMWSFMDQGIIPGALLMPQCVAASYRTIPPGFQVHNVQTHFIRIGTVTKPVIYHVENLDDGKTFATRQVKVEQNGKTIALTTVGFTKRTSAAGKGTAIVEYAVPVAMPMEAPREEYDVIKYFCKDRNPTLKGYALPIVAKGPSQAPESKLARHWFRADFPVSTEGGNMQNILGLIALSDIFVLDSATRIYGLGFDAKTEKSPSERLARDFKVMTTINHSIHIVNMDKVRVYDWVYLECETPWASNGRVMVHSRMFSRYGILLATCAQEGLVVLRKDASDRIAQQKL